MRGDRTTIALDRPDGSDNSPITLALPMIKTVGLVLLIILLVGRTSADIIGFKAYSLFHLFDLGSEMNLAAWWSASLILAAGLAFGLCAVQRCLDMAVPWGILCFICLLLSFDEVGSLHERLTDFTDASGAVVFRATAAVLISLAAYAGLRLLLHPRARRLLAFLIPAGALYASVVLQEYVQHRVDWPAWSVGLRAMVEEGTELLASFLLLKGVGRLPIQYEMKQGPRDALLAGLGIGLLLHVLLVCFYTVTLTDIPGRGDPGAWFPFALLFLLGIHASLDRNAPGSKGVAITLIALSTTMVAIYGKVWPLHHLLPGRDLPLYLMPLLLPFLMWRTDRRPHWTIWAATIGVAAFAFTAPAPGAGGVALGLFACLYALAFATAPRSKTVPGLAAAPAEGETAHSLLAK